MSTKAQQEAEAKAKAEKEKAQQEAEAKAKKSKKVNVLLCCVYGKKRPNEKISVDAEVAENLISRGFAKEG